MKMSGVGMFQKALCMSLADNFQESVKLVAETIRQFKPEQWTKGIDTFQVPWKIAYHIVECLDYYFREKPTEPFQWGHRFQGGWWELSDKSVPSQDALLEYLEEIEHRIYQYFLSQDDSQLATPFDKEKEHGETRLGHYAYALRHTMHHHGALSLLSLTYGNPQGTWE
jgi:uncharacterized damage-inducible protein DinB